MSCFDAPRPRLGAVVLALASLLGCKVDALFKEHAPPPAARLVFTPPPDAVAGERLSPPVQVSAVDDAGNVDTSFHLPFTITLGENPGRATLAGTRTVDPVRGVATFADLSLDKAGTGYTLVATAPGQRGVTSPPFNVTPAAAARLAFTAQPNDAVAGSVITPAVQVTAFDTLGNVVSSFTQNITMALETNPTGAALGGSKTAPAVNGVATFADLSVSEAGTGYTLAASASGLARATSDGFDITAAPPTTGDLTITTTTTGESRDPDGYVVTLDGGSSQAIGTNATITATGIPAGSHTVVLSGVASNCTVSNGTSRTVAVPAGGTVDASFTITCRALTGSLTVTTATTGQNAPTSYTVTVDGGQSRTLPANGGTTTYTGLAATSHTVALTDVPGNCTASGGASKTVTVTASETATAAFAITCTALTGSLTVTTATTGQNTPTSYTVTVDGGQSRTLPANGGTTTYTGLAATSHTVALTDVPGNCT
ncbi:MAG TPA: hypothetical protein VK531_00635, partial [Gemmatimonadales bacterium]|nr:hypothetical protein [Gemmatimonadales bacterium]